MSSLFTIWLVLLTISVVIGGIASCIRVRIPPVELTQTSVAIARDELVGPFLGSLEDGRFGFPSGKFVVAAHGESRLVARELVWWHPSTIDLTKRIWRWASGFGALGRIAVIIGLSFYWLGVGIFVTAADYLAKFLMRSTITATLEPSGDSSTQVSFTARGPSALLLRSSLGSAFARPILPPQIAAKAGLSAPEPVVAA